MTPYLHRLTQVFRKDKLPEELHDLLGLRIILTPAASPSLFEGNGEEQRVILRGGRAGRKEAAAKGALAAVSSVGEGEQQHEIVMTTTAVSASTATARAVLGGSSDSRSNNNAIEGTSISSTLMPFQEEQQQQPALELEGAELEAWLCHTVRELVLSLYEEVPGRFKNYVDHAKPNVRTCSVG